MILYEYFLVFTEGDIREINYSIPVSSFLDMNGNIITLPLPTHKMLVYQVIRKRTIQKEPGIVHEYYLLEQLDANELSEYV